MELKEFIYFLKKYLKALLLAAFLGGALGFLVSIYLPTRYRASITVYVERIPEKPELGDYSFDGYYAQQAAEAYTDTVVGFLQSLDILKKAIETGGFKSERLEEYSRHVEVKKIAPQLISITVTLPVSREAKELVVTLAQATKEQVQVFNKNEQAFSVDLLDSEPLIKEIKPWVALNTILAASGGLLVSLLFLLLRAYLTNLTAQND